MQKGPWLQRAGGAIAQGHHGFYFFIPNAGGDLAVPQNLCHLEDWHKRRMRKGHGEKGVMTNIPGIVAMSFDLRHEAL